MSMWLSFCCGLVIGLLAGKFLSEWGDRLQAKRERIMINQLSAALGKEVSKEMAVAIKKICDGDASVVVGRVVKLS